MSLSLLVRSSVFRQQVVSRARYLHTTPSIRSAGHGEYKFVPFSYDKKVPFGAKVAFYMVSGFSIPFLCAKWQLHKSQGA
ncbi:hypothetical protein BDZ94DRAFT_572355 [Collybia nuda]|uniref:Cytochrome c oxidase subunit 8, mitochondrial n=1 Tax=Collybia nuda TaxID=64659 RepID=A0A9P5YH03_9AGAR|nr:hypothetical protein BDZ94DRAFT_572355 [Collybia nuda]